MAETISKKKKTKKSPEKEMTFWEHLEELRWHLVRSIIVIVVLAVVAFLNRHIIFDEIILAPKDSGFLTNRLLCKLAEIVNIQSLCLNNVNLEIININMSGQFLTHMYVSIVAAIIVAFPYLLWEIWRFIQPALLPNEKKYSKGGVLASSLLFVIGILFSYYLIVPLTINFFGSYQVSETVQNTISLSSYISTVVSVTIAVGIVFELPILVYFLTKVGIVTPNFMKKNRKYMIVILLTVSAIITPPDIFSQIMVCIPLMLLYEFSIFVSRKVYQSKLDEEELAG